MIKKTSLIMLIVSLVILVANNALVNILELGLNESILIILNIL